MKKAMMGASAAAAIALAPICIPPAHAGPYDACSGISDPRAREDCIQQILVERPIPEEIAAKPPGYPAGSCRPSANPPPSPDAVAAADCFNNTLPGGPPVARYEKFADQNTLNNAFQTDARSTALQPCPGSSDSAPGTWNATNPPPASGSIMCYTSNDNMAHVEWTNTPDLVKANASGPDMASLYGWWHGLITTA
jgi:hypothetical protein